MWPEALSTFSLTQSIISVRLKPGCRIAARRADVKSPLFPSPLSLATPPGLVENAMKVPRAGFIAAKP